MRKSENHFEMVGRIVSMRKNDQGNLFIDLTVTQGDTVLKPTVYVPKEIPVTLDLNGFLFISGYVLGTADSNDMDRYSDLEQIYCAQHVEAARPKKHKYMPDEYLNVSISGELMKIFDSGHGWKKVVIGTDVPNGENQIVSNVVIGYYASDRRLIRVRDLSIGGNYEILIKPSTPERTRKRDNKRVVYQDLIAEFSRQKFA